MKRNRTVVMMAVVMVFTAIPFTNGDAYASTYADVYETRRSLQGDNAPQVALPHPQSTTTTESATPDRTLTASSVSETTATHTSQW